MVVDLTILGQEMASHGGIFDGFRSKRVGISGD